MFKILINIIFWLFIWQIITLIVNKEILVASPFAVLKRLFELIHKSYFWIAVLNSLINIIIGSILGLIVSVIFAVAAYKSNILKLFFQPLLVVIKSTPVASFIILLIIWINKQYIPTFASFIMVLPIMWNNIYTGIAAVNKEFIEVSKIFRLSKLTVIKKLYIPSVMPYFKSGCIISIGLVWKASIAAEVLCTPKNSIGKYIYESKIYLETADLFAWTGVVIILSLILEMIFVRAINKRSRKF